MIDIPVAVRARTAPVATPVATNSKKKPKPTSAKGAKRQRVSKATTNTATDDGVAAAVAQQHDKDGKLTYLTDASAIQLLTFLRSNPTIVSDSFQASLQPTYCSICDATTVALTCISAPGWQCVLTKVVKNVAIVLKSEWVREVEAIHSRQRDTPCFSMIWLRLCTHSLFT